MGVSAIVGGVAAVASVAGTASGMIGGGGDGGGGGASPPAMTEADRQRMQQAVDSAKGNVAPWRDAGGAAVNQWSGLMGLPGYTALDPTETLTGTPGYQFLRDQGTEALRRYGAGTGLLSSGAGMKGALDYGQNLALNKAWNPYMSSLQNLSGQGLQAGTSMGGYDMGMLGAEQQGMALQNQNNQNDMQRQMIDERYRDSQFSDAMGGLGYGITKFGNAFGGSPSGGNTILPPSSGIDNSWWNSGRDYQPDGRGYKNWLADGGPTQANRPYIVGERGPELFVPNVPGYVIPNEYTRYSSFGRRN